jgi:hypothetical protein
MLRNYSRRRISKNPEHRQDRDWTKYLRLSEPGCSFVLADEFGSSRCGKIPTFNE